MIHNIIRNERSRFYLKYGKLKQVDVRKFLILDLKRTECDFVNNSSSRH